jgi:hypothetical protein
MEARENNLQWNGSILLRMENEGMVVAVWTAEIAAGEKNDGAEFSWPIQEGSL